MNWNHSKYLSGTRNRIDHLRKIIAGRPVAILAAGPSINELEKRIEELRHSDICYFGMNSFLVLEDNILKKIDKRYSVILAGGNRGLPPVWNNIVDFLNRSEDNFYISSFLGEGFEDMFGPEFDLQKFLNKYDEKLFTIGVTDDRTLPDNNRPLHFLPSNSLACLIYLAIIGNASKIIIFGGDGHVKKNNKGVYYRPNEYDQCDPDPNKANWILTYDTNNHFNPVVPISLRNIYKTYNLEPIPILNCSEVSFLTPFPKISYNDAFAVLLDKKKVEDVSDLRIPTASIIIPHSGNEKEVQHTLKNIAEQSYSNYETIVIKRNANFLDTMKTALSSARGKYIFYCPAGDGYWHYNWINSCLEVLEKNFSKLSLVWGLSQNLLPDGAPGRIDQSYQYSSFPLRGKKHIYYWLKKKNFFPPNALCVRKEVLEKCMFPANENTSDIEFENWLNFSLRFNISGYLPAFIPETAAYHKWQDNDQEKNDSELLNTYKNKINNYKNRLMFGRALHHFRDSDNDILPGKFYLGVFLFYNLAKKIRNKLPRSIQLYLETLKLKVKKMVKIRLA